MRSDALWRALTLAALGSLASAAASAEPISAEHAGTALALVDRQSPLPKGTLTSPYPAPAEAAARGKAAYKKVGCQSCHGLDASRNPSLINDRWVFAGDDDTLFRLIALGSEALKKQGFERNGRENSWRPMPGQGELLTSDELWAIIAWLRTMNESSPPAAKTTRQ